jgi:hypothetical protein
MKRPPRPSLFDIIFVIWAIVVPVGFGSRLINSDGDMARHIRLGGVALDQHALPGTDFFSYTRAGEPFIAFEWGSEVLYAAAYRAAGLAGVAVFAGLVLALTYALLARFMIRRGGDPLLAYLTSMTAAVLSAGHWLARPHLFTMLAVVVLLVLIEQRGRRSLWLYVPFFLVWANLHGGFFYGCVVLVLYASGELLEAWLATDARAEWLARARHHLIAAVIGVAVSLVNPYGWHLLAHVAGFFGKSSILTLTQEFMSPDFHTVNGKLFLLVLLVVVAALSLSRRRPSFPALLLLLINLAFALIAQRNIELFALVALPLVGLSLDQEWRALPLLRRAKEVFQREHAGHQGGVGAVICTVLLLALAAAGGKVGGVEVVPDRFDPKAFPVAAVDSARSAKLEGNLFNTFIWGGYLLLAWPEQRVFIDGGTDHYGDEIFREYLQVWGLEPGWREVLQRHNVSLAITSPQARLADELVRDQGWTVWYCDSTAAILRRPAETPSQTSISSPPSSCTLPSRSQ